MKYDWEYIDYLIPGKRKIDFKAPTPIFVLFWDSLMFYQVFPSPQVKRCVIKDTRHMLYTSCLIFVAGGAFVPTQEKKKT